MEKRALLAVVLSLIVLIVYQEWLTRQYGPPPEPSSPAREEAEKPVAPQEPKPAPVPQARPPETPAVAAKAREVVVETDLYTATLTPEGGRLKSLLLKGYRASAEPDSGRFDVVQHAPGVPLPLGVHWEGAGKADDSAVVYRVAGEDLRLFGDEQRTLLLEGKTAGGLTITKKLTFFGSRYSIGLEVEGKTADGRAVPLKVALTAKSDHPVPNPDAPFEGLVALVDNKIRRQPASGDLKQPQQFTGDVAWAGFGYTYFFMALLPQGEAREIVTLQLSGPALILTLEQQNGDATGGRYDLFAGPKELSVLESVGAGMERSIDFGYFAFIAKPLLYALHFFHRFTGSYGIDIILLTIIIKIFTAPLTHKSYVSMKQMQKLQPQMERLKERYKDDREKLNKEIMEMYRRHGVNPLGGCLPMLLQFPVFIGLYNALSTPIELRHAPFLWIHDLSRPDWESLPFTVGDWHLGIPVLTILMGASMFVQQWMTPSAGDPNQRKMMLLMPLIFTFMFVTFPAGLTIYWLVNNILSIAQQWWINRMDK